MNIQEDEIELRYRIVEKNYGDLKRRYDDACSGKSAVETMIHHCESQLERDYANLCSLIEEARQCLTIIARMALKPNPLTQLDYIQLLIESEKNERKPGWNHRVKYLEECKGQVALLDVIKDDSIDQQIKKEQMAKILVGKREL